MSKPLYFPLFVDLSEKQILVVGAGKIASRRILTLAQFAGRITVVAPEIVPELEPLLQDPAVLFVRRPFEPEDLSGADLVFAATNDPKVNQQIGELARDLGIPVNVSHDQSLCDFFFPAVVSKPPMVIGLTASGQDHRGVKELKNKVAELLDPPEKE
ncbi:MAG: bifunctional precorrin-2 dehydrogenase/sirohydrochlorin ferrochelatase [Parasporobacterium sp.]|nr:bifunctional precorrin-2 dehydrogenase/sirohydrochlorin ferrochelatase [Parasporobacterium sp.]